ncbi:MAG: 50S ribosomal protein L18 [Candidatus Omnitrophica bacterium]|nr:50S ribosomal protein L18 [Candidatus Omnitrophota bacterium]MCB9747663.1 50S ribosomal protein L18 [Candidatus Omnitrophota bacterium]
MTTAKRYLKKQFRHARIRKKVMGTAQRPRLYVFRSSNNLYAQIVDDQKGKVLFGLSTRNKGILGKIKNGGNVTAAKILGEEISNLAQTKGVKAICFDRGGYKYHGRIKAFAEAAREAGMEF